MPSVLAQPRRKSWTRTEVDVLEAAGLLVDTRLEVIEGEVFDKIGQKPGHASAVCRMVLMLASNYGLGRFERSYPSSPPSPTRPLI